MKKVIIAIISLLVIGGCAAAAFFTIGPGKITADTVMLPKEKVEAKLRKNEWVTDRGQTYYYNDNGKKSSGMTVIGDKTYYFDTKLNYMKKGWVATDGRKHYFGEDGAMATGSVKAGDRTYYFDENGDMVTGWQEREGQTYYYDENGVQAFGLKQIDVKECCFDETTGAYKQVIIDTSNPMVAITYDDGPSAVTDRILDILEQNGAKATFFQIGNQVESYPNTEKRIAALGCELANHTWEHKWLSSLDVDGINYQLDHTNEVVEAVAASRPKLMRPPGGFYNETVQAEADMPMIYWSIDTEDWKTRDAGKTISAVLDHVKDGDIILMHDLYEQTAEASETIIPELIKRGYQLVTVSELAQARGMALENGKVYYSFY